MLSARFPAWPVRFTVAALCLFLAFLVLADYASAQEVAGRSAGSGGLGGSGGLADRPADSRGLGDSGDPVLDRLIADALEANPVVRAAEARTDGARAERFEAVLDLAPRVTAIGGYTRQRLSDATFPSFDGGFSDQDVWEAGTQLVWEIDVFGRLRNSLEARSALVGAAGENVGAARVRLATEIAAEYYALRGAQERLAVAHRNAENQRRTLELTLERLDAGRGTALDSERARAQLSTTLASIPTLEASLDASRNRIAVLLGRDPGAPGGALDGALGEGGVGEGGAAAQRPVRPALPERIAAPDAASLIRDRHDVRSADRRRAAGAAFVDAAQAGYLPQLSIRGGAGYTAEAFDRMGDSGTFRYGVGAVVSWPLFDLGRVKSRVDVAEAEAEAARRLYQNTLLEASEQIETSVSAYHAARERLDLLQDAADAAGRATELARIRFEAGATDFLEVLDAERRLLEAQDGLALGRLEATSAYVRVFRALGGVWPETADQ